MITPTAAPRTSIDNANAASAKHLEQSIHLRIARVAHANVGARQCQKVEDQIARNRDETHDGGDQQRDGRTFDRLQRRITRGTGFSHRHRRCECRSRTEAERSGKFRKFGQRLPFLFAFGPRLRLGVGALIGNPLANLIAGYGPVLLLVCSNDFIHSASFEHAL